MFNPFEPFKEIYIDLLRKKGFSFLVSQSYPRGSDPFADVPRTAILFTHYGDLSQAYIHLSALVGDKYASVIDLEHDKHREKIIGMLRPDSNYAVSYCILKNAQEAEQRFNQKYEKNIRKYINTQLAWPVPASDSIHPSLDIAFGEIFVLLKWRRNQVRIKLDDLEKI